MSDDDSMAVMIVLAIILEMGQTRTAYVFHVLFLYRLLVFNNEWSFSVLSLDIDILSSGNKKIYTLCWLAFYYTCTLGILEAMATLKFI